VRALDVTQDAVNGWHINNETGIVTGALASGAKLTATFEFDVPVWFESDQIGFNLQAYEPESKAAIYRLESVFVVEKPLPLAINPTMPKITEITQELDLGIIYETIETLEISNNKQELKSGYVKREAKRQDARLEMNLGGRNYDQAEVDKILAYFWNARGSLAEFPLKNLGKSYKVRFAQDQVNLRFEAASDSDKLFNLSGLKVQLKEQLIYRVPPYNFTVQTLSINPQNPNDPVITASNPPLSGSNPGNVFAGSDNAVSAFKLGTYSVGTAFAGLPPGGSTTGTWQATVMFWAAGALWLWVTNNTNNATNINWYGRSALYKLNASSVFEYVESNLKNYFVIASRLSPDRISILKTPTGVSVFVYGVDASVAFPNGTGNNSNVGLLRFELKDDGSQLIDFIPNSILSSVISINSSFLDAVAVFGDTVFVNTTSNAALIKSLGFRSGLNYIVGNIQSTGSAGFPVGHNGAAGSIYTNYTTVPDNFYSTASSNLKTLYYSGLELGKYYTTTQYNNTPITFAGTSIKQNQEGATFGKLIVNGMCNSGTSCTSTDSQNRRLIYVAPDYFSTPELIDNLATNGNTTQATYAWLQGFNSGFSSQFNHDRFGNSVHKSGSATYYYQAKSSAAINISSQIGNDVMLNETITPYGFALFFGSGSVFGAGRKIIFIQPQNP
jgi:hypothetical protein